MTKLKLSTDRKVAPYIIVNKNGKGTPYIKNAFGLPAGHSCPGITNICKDICYAGKIERIYKGAAALVYNNFELLKACGTNQNKMEKLLAELIEDFRKELARGDKKSDTPMKRVFRIHWDGDFYSVSYARAWATTIKANPDISFWAYTRSFKGNTNVVPILSGIENLSLYLSVDKENLKFSKAILAKHPDVKVALLDDTFESGLHKFKTNYNRGAPKCPEQTGRYSLVEGKEGACVACNMCIKGTNNVLFSTTKK